MARTRCIAVDWSGARDVATQRRTIWLAVAEGGTIVELIHQLSRDDVIDRLVDEIRMREVVAIGLDFAFSFPQWYLECRELPGVRDLWRLARNHGEGWLSGRVWPFWGRPGPYRDRPEALIDQLQFRQTERYLRGLDDGYNPKSVFQIYNPGAVGTGTIRGLPELARLQDAGAPIWPFDAPRQGIPTVIEIYPRLFYGLDITNKRSDQGKNHREGFLDLNYVNLGQDEREEMIDSPDAFDAGVSALHMNRCAEALLNLQQAAGPPTSLEGEIWYQLLPN